MKIERIPWLPKNWKKGIVPIGIRDKDERGNPILRIMASGFFVTRGQHVFIATARHVLEKTKQEIHIRFKLKNDSRLPENLRGRYVVINVDPSGARYHPDPRVDLAIFPIPWGKGMPKISFGHLDAVRFTEEIISDPEIEGDEVGFLGFPTSILGETAEHNQPILRYGIISLVPEHPFREVNDSRAFLIDGRAYPGNSGGPVFQKGDIYWREEGELRAGRMRTRLLGIISGEFPYRERAISEFTRQIRVVFEENSGLAVVVRASRISELFNDVLGSTEPGGKSSLV